MHSRILLALAVVLSVRQSYHSRYDGMGDSSIGHGARGDAPGAQDVSDGSGDPGSYVTTLTDEAADGVAEEVLEDIAEGRRPVPRTFGVLSNVAEILRDNKEVVDYEDDDAGERNWFGSSLSQKAGLVLAEKGSATHSLAETYTPVGKWKCDYDNVGGLMVYTGNCLRDVDYSYQNTADEFKAKALRDDLKAHYKTAADFVANVEGVANTPLQGWTSVSSQDPHHPNIIGAAVGGPNFAGSASALKAGLVLAEKGSLAEGEKNAHNKYKAYSTLDKKSSYQVWKQTAYEVGAKKVWWNPNHNAIVSRCATNRYWVGIEQGGNRAALCKVKRNIAVVLSGRIDEATYTRMMQGESTAFKGDEAETFKPKEKKKPPTSVLAEASQFGTKVIGVTDASGYGNNNDRELNVIPMHPAHANNIKMNKVHYLNAGKLLETNDVVPPPPMAPFFQMLVGANFLGKADLVQGHIVPNPPYLMTSSGDVYNVLSDNACRTIPVTGYVTCG